MFPDVVQAIIDLIEEQYSIIGKDIEKEEKVKEMSRLGTPTRIKLGEILGEPLSSEIFGELSKW